MTPAPRRRPLARLGEGLDARLRYDRRFKPAADRELIGALNALGDGARIEVRGIVFTRAGATWRNDFRGDLSTREVASIAAEGYTVL